MKMSELILAVGDENVVFQNLLNDADSIDKTKHGTRIVFYTDAIQANAVTMDQKIILQVLSWDRGVAAERQRCADEIKRLRAALSEISKHYANQDMNHVDFRVMAKQLADAALSPTQSSEP